MALALVAFTLFFLSVTMFGPARPDGAVRAATTFSDAAIRVSTVVVQDGAPCGGDDAGDADTTRDVIVGADWLGPARPELERRRSVSLRAD